MPRTFRTDRQIRNPEKSHDHDLYGYTKEEMITFGEKNGFMADYIGE
jgi:hypothetical protein